MISKTDSTNHPVHNNSISEIADLSCQWQTLKENRPRRSLKFPSFHLFR